MLQHAREIAPSVSWEILVRVKRSGGMSVNELAAELKMSYMGVKQHCDDLRKQGYVDTWRRPKGTGRPEKIYRPTPKLDLVLTNWGSELCQGVLAHAAQAYGESAPDRLLYSYLQQKAERWSSKMKGKSLRERLVELVKLRNSDGWMSELAVDEQGTRLMDHHSPLAEVARLYPNVWEMETRALTKIFGVPIERTLNGNRSEMRIITGDEPPLPVPVPLEQLVDAVATVAVEESPATNEDEAPIEVQEETPELETPPVVGDIPSSEVGAVSLFEAEPEVSLASEGCEPGAKQSSEVPETFSDPVPVTADHELEVTVPEPPVFTEVESVPVAESEMQMEPDTVSLPEEPSPPSVPLPVALKPKASPASVKKGQPVQADLFDF